MENGRKRRISESEFDSDTHPDKENESLEHKDGHNEQRPSRHSPNKKQFTQSVLRINKQINRIGISDESGIELESPCLTPTIDSNIYDDDCDEGSSDDSDSETSEVDEITHPRTRRTLKNIKLKIPLNIFKIDLAKVDQAIDQIGKKEIDNVKSNDKRIDFIVKTSYPKPKTKRGKKLYNVQRPTLNVSAVYVEQQYQGFFDVNNKFNLRLFYKRTFCKDDETGMKTTNLHKIRFLYRSDSEAEEIFALPSGSGRSVVMKWADTNFPLSVASAVLDATSVTEKEVKNLFDNRYLSKFKMVKGETLNTTPEFHLRFAPKIYTKFHATINDANGDLKRILDNDEGAKVKMQVQLESIMFPSAVKDINKYSTLCEKLSEIHRDPNLERSREFDGYLSKVSKNRKVELDNLLVKEIEKFFRFNSIPESDTQFGKLKHFIITQKNSEKYFEASKFKIHYKSTVRSFDERLQLQDFHSIVHKNIFTNNKSKKELIDRFNDLKISIEEESGKERFFNCVEGILYDDVTETNYWRVSSDWYQVSSKYTFEVYAEYMRVLKASLLDETDSPLKIEYPLISDRKLPDRVKDGLTAKQFKRALQDYKEKRFVFETTYNELYKDEQYFIVTDARVAPNDIEICDLFQYVSNPHGEPKIFLHHVKKTFNADGYRAAVCQILNAAYYLDNDLKKGGQENDSPSRKLYECVLENHEISLHYKDINEFRKQLRETVFVLSCLFRSGERDLDKDNAVLNKYDFSDFEAKINPELKEGLDEKLKSYLLDGNYIHRNGEFTAKWYEACSVKDDKGFYERNDRGFFFDSFPGSKEVRRILKEKYFKRVDGLASKQTIVQMSEALKSMGFGLKICQIEGADDDLLSVH